jgi:hypothetical protein
MDTAHYPELGAHWLTWDAQNIRHSVLPDIGPTVDTVQWLPLSVHCPIAELAGTLSKVLLSVCVLPRNTPTCYGFFLVDDIQVSWGSSVSAVTRLDCTRID